jgi:hypothetical protein
VVAAAPGATVVDVAGVVGVVVVLDDEPDAASAANDGSIVATSSVPVVTPFRILQPSGYPDVAVPVPE